jgi:hypothetical protein
MAKYVERALKKFPTILDLNQGNISQTCRHLKISRSTYDRLYNTDKEFAKACDEVQEILLDDAESVLHKQIAEGNTAALIFFLKTKGKSRGYIERSEVDARINQDLRIVIRE